jgi:hypothetical protein
MDRLKQFFKNSLMKIWEGFLNNIGASLIVLIAVGSCFLAIKVKAFLNWIHTIPAEYILILFVLFAILSSILIFVSIKQRARILKIKQELEKEKGSFRFVTHFGVWWKINENSEYIEDFPYCPCCEPKIKLVQTRWYPDELYQCPKTKTEIKLFDLVPRKRYEVLVQLYTIYYQRFPSQFEDKVFRELDRLKHLKPDISDNELFEEMFRIPPLNKLPKKEIDTIHSKFQKPIQAFLFLNEHYPEYKQFFKGPHL